ncbi:RidA family protein [Salinibaculum rarum]|uniref:RidA family protein n=1 Tax=Salinibaculum rarum TaxID=3058903 RepID=UPI00266034AB|nr:RidA family protein [Salinibaculum sp. KK48]
MSREVIQPDGLVDAQGIGYSHGIVEDGTLYMSGQVGWDEHFEVVGEDIQSQTRKAFENVETLLADVDRTLDDVRKVTAHIVDPPAHREGFFEVWNEVYADQPYPCLTILGPHKLAQEEFLVELEVEVPVEK